MDNESTELALDYCIQTLFGVGTWGGYSKTCEYRYRCVGLVKGAGFDPEGSRACDEAESDDVNTASSAQGLPGQRIEASNRRGGGWWTGLLRSDSDKLMP